MSDADDQLGGRGGPTGLDPAEATPGEDNAAPSDRRPADRRPADRRLAGDRGARAADQTQARGSDPDDDDRADESSRESFPASDPPGDY